MFLLTNFVVLPSIWSLQAICSHAYGGSLVFTVYPLEAKPWYVMHHSCTGTVLNKYLNYWIIMHVCLVFTFFFFLLDLFFRLCIVFLAFDSLVDRFKVFLRLKSHDRSGDFLTLLHFVCDERSAECSSLPTKKGI